MQAAFNQVASHYFPARVMSFAHAMNRILLACCVILSVAGCDGAELQNDFEAEAFAEPSGITRTDDSGKVVASDDDDWRVSPAYQARVVIDPAFPNPVLSGHFVSVPVRVRDFDAVQGGLELVSFDDNRIARRLDDILDARDPGAYVFRFNPGALGVVGLNRVFIIDNAGGLISYGDLLIEQ